jgi:DNA ligase-1
VALRFARVRGYRHDKTPQEADTIETIRAIGRGEIRPRLD